jgi:DNA-binding MarR family transcriptional regulator
MIEKAVRSHLRENCATTLPRFDVLSALDRAGEKLTMSTLSERLLVSNGNVTGVVARLLEDGLVAREADPDDRRAQRVFMTELGRRTFAEMAKEHEWLIDHIMAPLSGPEIAQLADQAGKLTESARAQLAKLQTEEDAPKRRSSRAEAKKG